MDGYTPCRRQASITPQQLRFRGAPCSVGLPANVPLPAHARFLPTYPLPASVSAPCLRQAHDHLLQVLLELLHPPWLRHHLAQERSDQGGLCVVFFVPPGAHQRWNKAVVHNAEGERWSDIKPACGRRPHGHLGHATAPPKAARWVVLTLGAAKASIREMATRPAEGRRQWGVFLLGLSLRGETGH